MAKKARAKTKRYTVQKRFEIWAAVDIEAENFDDAVEKSKGMTITDFVQPTRGNELIDFTCLPGTAVIEVW